MISYEVGTTKRDYNFQFFFYHLLMNLITKNPTFFKLSSFMYCYRVGEVYFKNESETMTDTRYLVHIIYNFVDWFSFCFGFGVVFIVPLLCLQNQNFWSLVVKSGIVIAGVVYAIVKICDDNDEMEKFIARKPHFESVYKEIVRKWKKNLIVCILVQFLLYIHVYAHLDLVEEPYLIVGQNVWILITWI